MVDSENLIPVVIFLSTFSCVLLKSIIHTLGEHVAFKVRSTTECSLLALLLLFSLSPKKFCCRLTHTKKHDFMIIITILFTFQVHQEEMAQLEV